MIRFTITMCFAFLIAFTTVYAQNCDSQNVFYKYNSFETGWGDWNKGGADCVRAGSYATNGNYSVRLRDNSGAASSVYSDSFDLSSKSQAVITFQYTQTGFEYDEKFKIQVSTDGVNYTTVRTFAAGFHFDHYNTIAGETNATPFGPYAESILIDGPFTATTSFRIMCDASDNGDRLFIDHLTIATDLCNDGLSNTINDVFDPLCICWGSTYDNDGDGVSVATDPNDYNPCLPVPVNNLGCLSCGDSILVDQNFDAGWGNWIDGGVDAARIPLTGFGHVIRLRDNSGDDSAIYTNDISVAGGTGGVSFEFKYYANSMEANENFLVEYSIDGGATYKVAKNFRSGIEFENGIIYHELIDIIDTDFSYNDFVRFKIRCDASGNGDLVYIDDILVKSCNISQPRLGNPKNEETHYLSEGLNIYPNPVKGNSQVSIDISDIDAVAKSIAVYDINGKLIEMRTIEEEELLLKIATTDYSQGTYMLMLNTSKGSIMKKFIVNN